jgi:hypothetical protein
MLLLPIKWSKFRSWWKCKCFKRNTSLIPHYRTHFMRIYLECLFLFFLKRMFYFYFVHKTVRVSYPTTIPTNIFREGRGGKIGVKRFNSHVRGRARNLFYIISSVFFRYSELFFWLQNIHRYSHESGAAQGRRLASPGRSACGDHRLPGLFFTHSYPHGTM